VLLNLGLVGPVGASSGGDKEIPFREAWGFAVVVPVQVGGAGVHEFLLDTGATYTVLEPGLAQELAEDAVPAAPILSLAGEIEASTARVDLMIGSRSLPGVEVRVAPLPAIRSDEPRVRGLLGQSALQHLDYTIDHARRRLVLHGAPAASSPPVAPGSGARPVLLARLGCGAPSRFVLDSGVSTPVLFQREARPLPLALGRPVRATTNGGSAVWREARLPSFCVAGRRFAPVSVVVRPEAGPPREEDGLLPSRFFARVRVGKAGEVMTVDFW
jgi:predicted aspartyl protease